MARVEQQAYRVLGGPSHGQLIATWMPGDFTEAVYVNEIGKFAMPGEVIPVARLGDHGDVRTIRYIRRKVVLRKHTGSHQWFYMEDCLVAEWMSEASAEQALESLGLPVDSEKVRELRRIIEAQKSELTELAISHDRHDDLLQRCGDRLEEIKALATK